MVFRSKMDSMFILIIAFTVIIAGGIFLLPLLLDETSKSDMITSLALFGLTIVYCYGLVLQSDTFSRTSIC